MFLLFALPVQQTGTEVCAEVCGVAESVLLNRTRFTAAAL